MYYITTKQARKDICRARMGEIDLPRVTHIVFGTGGHDPDDITKPLPIDPDAIGLEAPVLTKAIASATKINDTTIEYLAILGAGDADGAAITEAALQDENGNIVAIKRFGAKTKDPDTEYDFKWEEFF